MEVCNALHTFTSRIRLRGNMIGMSAGTELVERVIADMRANGLEPDGREVELLDLASGLADRLADLEACVDRDGLSMVLKSGRVVINPAVSESRLTRNALATVLGRVSMEEGRAKDPAKQRAAQARWRAHNIAKAQRSG
jgi:hypothetical protein